MTLSVDREGVEEGVEVGTLKPRDMGIDQKPPIFYEDYIKKRVGI